MRPMSLRERRLVALLILVAMIALVWLVFLFPLIDGFRARQDERADLLSQHQRNMQVAARLPVLRAEAVRQRAGAARFALPGRDAKAAAAMLRERVRRLAQRHQIVMQSVQEIEAGAGEVRVRADGTFQTEQLTAFLKDLQNQDPAMLVSSLTVVADAAFETGQAAPLGIRFEVSSAYSVPAQR